MKKDGTGLRFCRLCDIIDSIPDDISDHAQKLYELLDEKERAGESLIKTRMDICKDLQGWYFDVR